MHIKSCRLIREKVKKCAKLEKKRKSEIWQDKWEKMVRNKKFLEF